MLGIVVKAIKDSYTIKYTDKRLACKTKGTLKKDYIKPLVGDTVLFDESKKLILHVFERRNKLTRPPICNAQQAIIVISAKEPIFSSYLLDKSIIIAEHNKIKPIIYISKTDLLSFKEKWALRKYIKYYRSLGYLVFTNKDINKLKKTFAYKITVLTGQSGVGKSTLLNKLDSRLSLKTDTISASLKRGKHTTKHVELYDLYDGLVADTPGFSTLDFTGLTKEDIRDNMIEFKKYNKECKYHNCFHLKETTCKVKEMVNKGVILSSRYENYKKFMTEI